MNFSLPVTPDDPLPLQKLKTKSLDTPNGDYNVINFYSKMRIHFVLLR